MGGGLSTDAYGEFPFPGEHPMSVMYSITNVPPSASPNTPWMFRRGCRRS